MTFAFARTLSIAAVTTIAAASAQALTIPTNALVADSIQAFSADAVDSFNLFGVTVTPLGNATAVSSTPNAYSFPVTSITIGLSGGIQLQSGDAKGSALEIARQVNGVKKGLTVANFTINFTTHQVLADTTPIGGATVKQTSLYNFDELSPLSIKYQFPLSITANQVLGNLKLTDSARATMISSLQLPPALANIVLPTLDFGTITQKISVAFRSKPVSTTPYVPAY
ncbi:MAG TPA: hypothetical protein VEQ09_07745 [Aquabacterium sp.]|nr:hypothetical protein [Aquabacterium sp.]